MNKTDRPAAAPTNTTRLYAHSWSEFEIWCAHAGLAARPASGETLETYTAMLCAADYAPGTIGRSIAAIRAHHINTGHRPPDTHGARTILATHRLDRACRGRTPHHSKILSLAELHTILATCDTDTLPGLRDAVILTLGTALMAGPGLLGELDLADITASRHGVSVRVRSSARTAIVVHGRDRRTDPAALTLGWVDELADREVLDGPLLRSCGRGGRLETSGRLGSNTLNLIVRRRAKTAEVDGWQHVTCHTLRATGASLAAAAGVPAATIAGHGHWAPASPAVYEYIDAANSWSRITMPDIGI